MIALALFAWFFGRLVGRPGGDSSDVSLAFEDDLFSFLAKTGPYWHHD